MIAYFNDSPVNYLPLAAAVVAPTHIYGLSCWRIGRATYVEFWDDNQRLEALQLVQPVEVPGQLSTLLDVRPTHFRQAVRETAQWTTARGEVIAIPDLQDSHLRNVHRTLYSRNVRNTHIDEQLLIRSLAPLEMPAENVQRFRTLLTSLHGLWPSMSEMERAEARRTLRWFMAAERRDGTSTRPERADEALSRRIDVPLDDEDDAVLASQSVPATLD